MSILLAALLASGGATAETPVETADDPVICRREIETGSRLQARRICMTRSQWEEQRRQQRQAIERAQVQRPMEN
jgi:hypothetical protein